MSNQIKTYDFISVGNKIWNSSDDGTYMTTVDNIKKYYWFNLVLQLFFAKLILSLFLNDVIRTKFNSTSTQIGIDDNTIYFVVLRGAVVIISIC